MKRLLLFVPAILLLMAFSCTSTKSADSDISVNFDYEPGILPVPEPGKLPVWKGFNLLNMFYRGGGDNDKPFVEEEFKMISEWGFNFVRIPMDYRIFTKPSNWDIVEEYAVRRIDKAIEYGMKYNIHVCLNLHRAPGYTVANPPEKTNLWTDKAPQEAFAHLWGYLAKRYKDIPVECLSFNLVNEPANVEEAVYAAVMKKAIDAIREHNPNRIIITDGLRWGGQPSAVLSGLGAAQATRGYTPMTLTHYKAEWVEGADMYSIPEWPSYLLPGYLYSPSKHEVPWSAFSIKHDFRGAYNLDVNVGVVSGRAHLVVKADNAVIYDNVFTSGPGKGEWTKAVYREEWNIYQNIFDKDYRVVIPSGTQLLTLEVSEGDWMTINAMQFSPVSGNGVEFSITPNTTTWGERIPPVSINALGEINAEGAAVNREWLWETSYKPWEKYMDSKQAIVGEWGSHNRTPHDVTLRWMEDNLEIFKEHDLGWALWNLTGSFGILNSGRTDVQYENYRGYRLDRKMLDLLLRYVE